MKSAKRVWVLEPRRSAAAIIFLWPLVGLAQSALAPINEVVFRDPTFEQLALAKVTSVTRKEQSYFTTPAAVYVIGADEIIASGVRSIPEALRLAPGVEVARLNTHRYAVGIRGFNNEFTSKLLVLQDGRSLYTPLFAGMFWDMEDILLDDVERIEVVRGPGGTAWGANAVNGVINIVTKRAADTQGMFVSAGGGSEEKLFGALRYGGKFSGASAFRVYLTGASRNESASSSALAPDDAWQQVRGGFRIESPLTAHDLLTVHGEAFDGSANQETNSGPTDINVSGAYVLGLWERQFTADDRLSAQIYFDTSRRASGQGIADRDDWAIDIVQHVRIGQRHDVTFGVNYRRSDNRLRAVPELVFVPSVRKLGFASAFIDDAVRFFDNRLTVSAGAKLERNDFTRNEWLPNVRALWQPVTNQVLWVAAARGVRMPSIADNDSTASFPGFLSLPNTELPAEDLKAYELGWRMQVRWSLDASLYRNYYNDLRTRETQIIPVPPTLIQMRDAKMSGTTQGAEFTVTAQVSPSLRLQANANYLEFNLHLKPGSTDLTAIADASTSPRWQVGLRSSWRMSRDWDVHTQYRYVAPLTTFKVPVASYQSLDMNLTWHVTQALELSFTGQNLLSPRHTEFRNYFTQPPSSDVQRGAYLQLRWLR